MFFEFDYKSKVYERAVMLLTSFTYALCFTILFMCFLSFVTDFSFDMSENDSIILAAVLIILLISANFIIYQHCKTGVELCDGKAIIHFGFWNMGMFFYKTKIKYDSIIEIEIGKGCNSSHPKLPSGVFIIGGNYRRDYLIIKTKKCNYLLPVKNCELLNDELKNILKQ